MEQASSSNASSNSTTTTDKKASPAASKQATAKTQARNVLIQDVSWSCKGLGKSLQTLLSIKGTRHLIIDA